MTESIIITFLKIMMEYASQNGYKNISAYVVFLLERLYIYTKIT